MSKFGYNRSSVYISGDSMASVSDVMNLLPRLNYTEFCNLAAHLKIDPSDLEISMQEFLHSEAADLKAAAMAEVKEAK